MAHWERVFNQAGITRITDDNFRLDKGAMVQNQPEIVLQANINAANAGVRKGSPEGRTRGCLINHRGEDRQGFFRTCLLTEIHSTFRLIGGGRGLARPHATKVQT